MTTLLKKVSRRTERRLNSLDQKHRHIVVSLEPGDLISMRLDRSRHSARLPIATVFAWMVSVMAEAELAEKRARRKARAFGKEVA